MGKKWMALYAADVVECTACDLKDSQLHVPGTGTFEWPVLFVGEAPGRMEALAGSPFIGPSGQLLFEMFVAGGLDPLQCYVTNVVKCRPPNNRVPTKNEISACSEHTYTLLVVYKPTHVIIVGNTSLSWARNTFDFDVWDNISTLSGRVIPAVHRTIKSYHTNLCFLLHPSFIMRNLNQWKPVYQDHINQIILEIEKLDRSI